MQLPVSFWFSPFIVSRQVNPHAEVAAGRTPEFIAMMDMGASRWSGSVRLWDR